MWPLFPSVTNPWVPTYYIFTSLAFTVAIFWAFKRAQKQDLDAPLVLDLAIAIMLGAFIGARLFHVLLEDPAYYRLHPGDVFKFWVGGFVFYGGFWGALVAVLLLKLKKDFDFYTYADMAAPVIAFGYGLGRLGCFANGCCFGKATNMPWGILFPPGSQAPSFHAIHPTQLYATGWEWILVAALLYLEKKNVLKRSGQLFGVWLIAHGLGRAVIEQFRDDFRGQSVFNLSISTWISILVLGTGLWLVLRKGKQRASTSVSIRIS